MGNIRTTRRNCNIPLNKCKNVVLSSREEFLNRIQGDGHLHVTANLRDFAVRILDAFSSNTKSTAPLLQSPQHESATMGMQSIL